MKGSRGGFQGRDVRVGGRKGPITGMGRGNFDYQMGAMAKGYCGNSEKREDSNGGHDIKEILIGGSCRKEEAPELTGNEPKLGETPGNPGNGA